MSMPYAVWANWHQGYWNALVRCHGVALLQHLQDRCAQALRPGIHGDLDGWLARIAACSLPSHGTAQLDQAMVALAQTDAWTANQKQDLHALATVFKPWRKGPFLLGPLALDAEWRCDLKWQRLAQLLPSRPGKVLDVGCGNGYYALRMLGAGAELVTGLDPTLPYVMQAAVLQRLQAELPWAVLPLRLEDVAPEQIKGQFDWVLSLGVLYHHRSPLEHLRSLKQTLAPGGRLLLETLVVPGGVAHVLMPAGRYAGMRNIWFLPSEAALLRWCERLNFHTIERLDCTPTTPAEQRVTAWSGTVSLQDFLDPEDDRNTREGHPAPRRLLLCLG